jgi:protease-4
MSLNNLHSLITGRWFIDKAYSQALLPSLYAVLNGKRTFSTPDKPTPESFIFSANKSLVSASSFDNETNKDNYVLVVSLKNPIYKYNQECGPGGTKSKQQIMSRYESDPNCKGIVLDIDSGGGQVSGTPEFHDFIKNYSKPVVAYTDGMMCSAAYYIGSAAKHIIANKRADAIGSIGTMIHFVDMTGFYEKKGAKIITEYATKSTNKNKDFENLLKGNPEGYIKNELDPITETFHADMNSARPNLNTEVLSGGTYNSEDSLKNGLIDEIGILQTAIDKVFSLAKANNNNSKLNNSKNNTMSKLNVPLIEAVIGSSFTEGETENGIILTDKQATAIESRLSENDTAIATAKTAATESATTIANLTTTNTTATTAIQNALATAEVEDAAKMSNEEGIVALSALVTEYGSKDGGKPTIVINSTEGDDNTEANVIGGIDISAAMNN